jgi:hypothetical protein
MRAAHQHIFAKAIFYTVNGLVKVNHFLGIVPQVNLIIAGYMVTLADADKPHQ